MTEADITKKIIHALRSQGYWATKIHGGAYQSAGLPDVIACCEGIFVGLEVKKPGKERTLTRLQALTLKKLDNAGAITSVVTSVEEALDVVRTALDEY